MGFWSSLGNIAKGALPIVGGLVGGPLGGALGGALGGLLGGGGGQGALQGGLGGGMGGFVMNQMKQANDEANKDRKRARGLADQAVNTINHGQNVTNQQWALGAPMRDAFRFGALNFSDPTNPFSRGGMFAPFQQAFMPESQMPVQQPPPSNPDTSTRKAKPRQDGGAGGGRGGWSRKMEGLMNGRGKELEEKILGRAGEWGVF